MKPLSLNRRRFVKDGVTAGAALAMSGFPGASRADDKAKRIRIGVIGCGSVSGVYLPNLTKCPYVDLVSTCDIIPERAERRAKQFHIPHHYPHIDKMLAGTAFDLLVTLTDMQEHEHLNRQALQAGKHGIRSKPMKLEVPMGTGPIAAGVLEATLPGSAVPVFFVAVQRVLGRDGETARPAAEAYGPPAPTGA